VRVEPIFSRRDHKPQAHSRLGLERHSKQVLVPGSRREPALGSKQVLGPVPGSKQAQVPGSRRVEDSNWLLDVRGIAVPGWTLRPR
jgi:hypothetical protein